MTAAPGTSPTERVAFTSEAADVVRRLTAEHGSVMFHQSGGCCDGSSPMCFARGEFLVGGGDVLVGSVALPGLDDPVDVWMSRPQFGYWEHTHLTIDVVAGRGAGFSLEAPDGVRFLIRSRLFSDDEHALLAPVRSGDDDVDRPT